MALKISEFINGKLAECENLEEENIAEIAQDVREVYKTKCDYFYAGKFDSPGYDAWYYVIAFIDEDGELGGVNAIVESY